MVTSAFGNMVGRPVDATQTTSGAFGNMVMQPQQQRVNPFLQPSPLIRETPSETPLETPPSSPFGRVASSFQRNIINPMAQGALGTIAGAVSLVGDETGRYMFEQAEADYPIPPPTSLGQQAIQVASSGLGSMAAFIPAVIFGGETALGAAAGYGAAALMGASAGGSMRLRVQDWEKETNTIVPTWKKAILIPVAGTMDYALERVGFTKGVQAAITRMAPEAFETLAKAVVGGNKGVVTNLLKAAVIEGGQEVGSDASIDALAGLLVEGGKAFEGGAAKYAESFLGGAAGGFGLTAVGGVRGRLKAGDQVPPSSTTSTPPVQNMKSLKPKERKLAKQLSLFDDLVVEGIDAQGQYRLFEDIGVNDEGIMGEKRKPVPKPQQEPPTAAPQPPKTDYAPSADATWFNIDKVRQSIAHPLRMSEISERVKMSQKDVSFALHQLIKSGIVESFVGEEGHTLYGIKPSAPVNAEKAVEGVVNDQLQGDKPLATVEETAVLDETTNPVTPTQVQKRLDSLQQAPEKETKNTRDALDKRANQAIINAPEYEQRRIIDRSMEVLAYLVDNQKPFTRELLSNTLQVEGEPASDIQGAIDLLIDEDLVDLDGDDNLFVTDEGKQALDDINKPLVKDRQRAVQKRLTPKEQFKKDILAGLQQLAQEEYDNSVEGMMQRDVPFEELWQQEDISPIDIARNELEFAGMSEDKVNQLTSKWGGLSKEEIKSRTNAIIKLRKAVANKTQAEIKNESPVSQPQQERTFKNIFDPRSEEHKTSLVTAMANSKAFADETKAIAKKLNDPTYTIVDHIDAVLSLIQQTLKGDIDTGALGHVLISIMQKAGFDSVLQNVGGEVKAVSLGKDYGPVDTTQPEVVTKKKKAKKAKPKAKLQESVKIPPTSQTEAKFDLDAFNAEMPEDLDPVSSLLDQERNDPYFMSDYGREEDTGSYDPENLNYQARFGFTPASELEDLLARPLLTSGIFNSVRISDQPIIMPDGSQANASIDQDGNVVVAQHIDVNTFGHEAGHALIELLGENHTYVRRLLELVDNRLELALDTLGDMYFASKSIPETTFNRIATWLEGLWITAKETFGIKLTQDQILNRLNNLLLTSTSDQVRRMREASYRATQNTNIQYQGQNALRNHLDQSQLEFFNKVVDKYGHKPDVPQLSLFEASRQYWNPDDIANIIYKAITDKYLKVEEKHVLFTFEKLITQEATKLFLAAEARGDDVGMEAAMRLAGPAVLGDTKVAHEEAVALANRRNHPSEFGNDIVNSLLRIELKIGRKLTAEERKRMRTINFLDPDAVRREISSMTPLAWADLVNSIMANGLLTGKAVFNNILLNAATLAYHDIELLTRGSIDGVMTALTLGKRGRTAYASDIFPAIRGQLFGLKKGAKLAWDVLLDRDAPNVEDNRAIADFGIAMVSVWHKLGEHYGFDPKVTRGMELVMNLGLRALSAGDLMFRMAHFNGELAIRANRDVLQAGYKYGTEAYHKAMETRLNNLTEEDKFLARQIAADKIFMGKAGKFLNEIKKLRNAGDKHTFMGALYTIAAYRLIPFVHTFGKITEFGIRRTPGVGLLFKGQRDWLDSLTEQTTGAALFMLLWGIIDDDDDELGLTTGLPSDPGKRAMFYREGKQPWSFKVGDNQWISYEKDSLGLTMKLIASTIRYIKSPSTTMDEKSEAFAKIGNDIRTMFADAPFIGDIAPLVSPGASRELAKIPSGWVPYNNMFYMAGRLYEAVTQGYITPKDREHWTDYVYIDPLRQLLPGATKDMPDKINVWGETVHIPTEVLQEFLPYKWWSKMEPDKVEKALAEVGYYPSMPSQRIVNPLHAAQSIEIPEELYRDYAIYRGRLYKQLLDKVVGSPGYSRANLDAKMRMLKTVEAKVGQASSARLRSELLRQYRPLLEAPR